MIGQNKLNGYVAFSACIVLLNVSPFDPPLLQDGCCYHQIYLVVVASIQGTPTVSFLGTDLKFTTGNRF